MKISQARQEDAGICASCARAHGAKPKDKIVGVWQGNCAVCGQTTSLTAASHDWNWPKTTRSGADGR